METRRMRKNKRKQHISVPTVDVEALLARSARGCAVPAPMLEMYEHVKSCAQKLEASHAQNTVNLSDREEMRHEERHLVETWTSPTPSTREIPFRVSASSDEDSQLQGFRVRERSSSPAPSISPISPPARNDDISGTDDRVEPDQSDSATVRYEQEADEVKNFMFRSFAKRNDDNLEPDDRVEPDQSDSAAVGCEQEADEVKNCLLRTCTVVMEASRCVKSRRSHDFESKIEAIVSKLRIEAQRIDEAVIQLQARANGNDVLLAPTGFNRDCQRRRVQLDLALQDLRDAAKNATIFTE